MSWSPRSRAAGAGWDPRLLLSKVSSRYCFSSHEISPLAPPPEPVVRLVRSPCPCLSDLGRIRLRPFWQRLSLAFGMASCRRGKQQKGSMAADRISTRRIRKGAGLCLVFLQVAPFGWERRRQNPTYISHMYERGGMIVVDRAHLGRWKVLDV